MDYDMLVNLAMEMGCTLMASGAEIYRVEESLNRLLAAYGRQDAQVFAIPSCLIVSLQGEGSRSVTRMSRIPAHGTDIELLERCNDLCRRLCQQTPPLEEGIASVEALRIGARRYRPLQTLFGYALAPASFTALFGGDLWDSLCAFLCGGLVGLSLQGGVKWMGRNVFLRTVVCSGIAALLALLLFNLGLGNNVDLITIGTLMLLVPGVAITNSMWELVAGDTYSGLSRMAEAILVATAIALGAAAGLGLGQLL